ncbi:MAG: 50S ribosomal protein L21 [OCS116 cluster bacterium]|nr:50S ribosomal protein L21 [OCS116 cluster bacterium]
MFAVIRTGGKQYKVAKDDILQVEKLEVEAGDIITLDDVLMLGGDKVEIGTPTVAGAAIACEVLEQKRDKKIIVFKKKRRQNYRRKAGHRQHKTVLRVLDILTDGKKAPKTAAPKAAKAVEKAAPKAKAEKAAAASKAAAKKAAPKAAAKADDAAIDASTLGLTVELLSEPNGKKDNLTKLSAIGKVGEKKLNDIGIFHYSQMAQITKEDAVKLDEAYTFKGDLPVDVWATEIKELTK